MNSPIIDLYQGVARARKPRGIARSQLLQWRRLFRPERTETAEQPTGFVPAVVVPDREAAPSTAAGSAVAGAIEIEFASGARMRITGAVDPAALKAAVEALTGGRAR